MMDLERLFRPKSIAVFGGGPAEEAVRQLDRMGFAGEIWPVHPTRGEVAGRRCFRSVGELPGAPDAAFIGVNRRETVAIVGALAERGAGGVVCYASGFSEGADGGGLQEALIRAAGDMPILGPNCYGFINYLDGALLWPDQHGGVRTGRGVAIVTQSSNIAVNMTMQRRGLPVAMIATAGNQAQTGLADLAAGFLGDPRITAIGLHVEGVHDVRRFEALAAAARERRVPIVALTVGRSEESRAAAISHTASLAGSAAAVAAFFDRIGIPRLASIPEFLEALKLLHVHGPLAGKNLCSMSCSGGEASIMADAALGRSVRFRPLSTEEKQRVQATLSDLVTVANPLDYHTFVWGKEAAMAATFSGMIGCGFDLSVLVLDFPREDRCSDGDWDVAVRAITAAAKRSGGRAAVVATLPENMPEKRAAELMAQGIVPLCGVDEALAAAEAAAFIGARWREPPPSPVLLTSPLPGGRGQHAKRGASGRGSATSPRSPPPGAAGAGLGLPARGRLDHAACGGIRTLSEAEAKALLAEYGVRVPEGRVVATPDEAIAAAEAIGFPVVVKALGLAHKSEAGAVRLDMRGPREVWEAAAALLATADQLLIEAMVADSVAELLVGVVRDPQFGLLMTIAAGGVLVELLGDAVSLLLPATEPEIRSAILSLKTAPLLQGFRGRPPADLDSAIAAIMAIADYVDQNCGAVEELEVNPLLVLSQGRGAVAVDALIHVREG